MTEQEHPAPNADEVADATLVERTRAGDEGAFADLWRRHYRSGIVVARSITSSIDPDDLVQEAYTRIFQAIQRGGGPTGAFRAYLFSSIRNAAASWGRGNQETAIDELDAVADPTSTEAAAEEALDRGLTHRAFRSLPTRWQEVLWYTEIEQMKPAAVAPILGMNAIAVSQLASRAREGLREAWITAHLASLDDGSACQWVTERLATYSRGTASKRDTAKIEDHLATCARCAIVASEAKDVSRRLALVLLPLTVGATGAAAYVATLQGGGTAVAALAAGAVPAMPGAVVAGGTAAVPANITALFASSGGAAAGGSAGTGGGAGGGGAAGAGGSATTGIATVVGIAAAGVLIAGAAIAGTTLGQQRSEANPADSAQQSDGTENVAASITAPDPAAAPTPAPLPSDLPPSIIPAPSHTQVAPSPRPSVTIIDLDSSDASADDAQPAEDTATEAATPDPVPDPTVAIPEPTASPSPSDTAQASPTAEPEPEPSVTPEPSVAPEPPKTPQPSLTPEPSATPAPSVTPEPSATPKPTATPEPSATPEPTATPEPSATPEPTATSKPTTSPEPSATPKPTATPDPTPTPEPTESPAIDAPTSVAVVDSVSAGNMYSLIVHDPDHAAYTLVAVLDGSEIDVRRIFGWGSLALSADQYASSSLAFAYRVDGELGELTPARTPQEWDSGS